ncbi:uncharacterized protein FIBRA_00168 [Fibroporia radiculosa]|uniref:Major facilitator superfamily (MFS) profile domain-containing protein n=1 Tax=Fibroporia radiculosa TaxID=599839 RepID=J7S5R7_9APHY|nr:uncharacterized protein FIBRA_00168 [Fibroporia radiculosa]CCL98174.1 predicted protein [Fibroporia radiculosa]
MIKLGKSTVTSEEKAETYTSAESAPLDTEVKSSHEDDVAAPSISSSKPGFDIPNGGVVAWLQVAGSFFLIFNSWGIANTYGVYQTFYEENILSSMAPSAISWIGSIQGFLLLMFGVLTGPIFDMGYFYSLLAAGTFLIVFGMMMTSLSTQYYQVLLSQGICVGLGSGCLFVPSVAIVAMYFSKRRAFAIGIAASGSSIGGVIYPAIFHQLQPKVGFGWATRVIGFVALGTQIFALAVMRRRSGPTAPRQIIDKTAWREAPYVLFALATFFAFMGLYIPFFNISTFAEGKTGASVELAFYSVPIISAASTFGRILPGLIADRVGPLNMLAPSSVASAILVFSWAAVHNVGGLVTFALLYGLASGAIVSLAPSVVATLTPDLRRLGGRIGMQFSIAGLGLLIGNPIAGAIENVQEREYLGAQMFCGAILMASTIATIGARIAKTGPRLMVKA